jgi:hypothetical protein
VLEVLLTTLRGVVTAVFGALLCQWRFQDPQTHSTPPSHSVSLCVQIIKVEAHPIPEHMRARRVVGRAALVGECFTRESS